MVHVGAFASAWQPRQLMGFTTKICHAWNNPEFAAELELKALETSKIKADGVQIGNRYRLPGDDESKLELEVIERAGAQSLFSTTLYGDDDKPLLLLSLNSDCSLRVARKINYSDQGQALNIASLDADLAISGELEWLNPPLYLTQRSIDVPLKHPGEAAPAPLRVAMVDSGVNYQLPEINQRLARDEKQKLIGYDFWDLDELPYDAHPLRSEFFVQRHGTRTASLLLREAPGIELVPYRYPRPDMTRMKALVEHADRNQITIMGMPLGSNRAQEWQAFEQAAAAHPQILFIVSAGNNGRDIDSQPVYPAALDLENVLVVTSADDFVRPADRMNWGKKSVDYLIPAENLTVTDYSGKTINASGSSYAVSRMTALAAKLKMAQPHWKPADILAELRRRYSVRDGVELLDWVSTGYIADPLAGHPLEKLPYPELSINSSQTVTGSRLALNILVLDQRWTHTRIERAVQTAYDLLAQCAIGAGELSIHAIAGDDYLRDLSTGSARTLLEAIATKDVTVVFARDTRMQDEFTGEAFGLSNTRTRPWLTNSIWLMQDLEDSGIALAHELFHVIANSGKHVEGVNNLMQSRTDPGSLSLTSAQCRRARVIGDNNRLLSKGYN